MLWWLTAGGLLFACVFIGLDHPLQNLNEGLYARVAQEMRSSGDWVIPTLNGIPYLEKPPLLYWMTAAAFATFGAGEVAARAAPVAGLLLALLAIGWFAARRLGASTAAVAVAMAVSSPVMVVMGRTLMLDGLFTGLLSAALVLGFEALECRRTGLMRASLAFLALAVLAKGLAALVFFVIALMPLALAREGRAERLRLLLDPGALALFAVVAIPWHLAATMREPGFAWFYFVNEHLLRFTGQREPQDFHTGPWWYYLPRLALYAFPWALMLCVPARSQGVSPRVKRFLLAWLLGPLVVFSLAVSKADYYMMIALPALVLLAACRWKSPRGAVAFRIALAADVLFWVAVLVASLHWPGRSALPAWASAAAAAAVVLALLGTVLGWRRPRPAAVFATAATALPLALLYSGFLGANAAEKSARAAAERIAALGPTQVYVYRDYESVSALPFYLARHVNVVDSASADLAYGGRLRPADRHFVGSSDIPAGRSVVVVPERRLAEFRASPWAAWVVPGGREGSLHLFTTRTVEHLAAQGTPTPP